MHLNSDVVTETVTDEENRRTGEKEMERESSLTVKEKSEA